MNRRFDPLPPAAVTTACALLLFIAPASGQTAERQQLTGHVPKAVASLQPIERLAATNRIKLAITLRLGDSAGLTNFLRQVYDPASPNYHQFLTPAEFTTRFGPPWPITWLWRRLPKPMV